MRRCSLSIALWVWVAGFSASSAAAAEADLAVSTGDGQATAAQGSPLTYTVLITNLGPDDALGAGVAINLPAALNQVSWTCLASAGSQCPTGGSGNVSSLIDLAAGGSATFTVQGSVAEDATGVLTQSAAVLSPGGTSDPDTSNNSATDTTDLTALVDLGVELDDGRTTVIPGETLSYTLVADNAGPQGADGATVTLDVPDNGQCMWTCAPSGGADCGTGGGIGGGNGDLAQTVDLPPTSRVTYTVDCSVPSSQTAPWLSRATVTAGSATTELRLDNNTASDQTSMAPRADVYVQVSDGLTTAVPGSAGLTYTLTAGNLGPSDAASVVVTDDFPALLGDLQWICVTTGAAVCTPSGTGDVLDTVTLPAGTSVTYFADGTVPGDAHGTLLNIATVTPPGHLDDPDENNNQAADSTQLTPQADLRITKTDHLATVAPGTPLTYVLEVTNTGPSDAFGSTVTDVLAEELSCTWTCLPAPGAACPAQGVGHLQETVDLPTGGTLTFHLACDLAATAGSTLPNGVLSNSATVLPPPQVTELNPANNQATDLTQLAAEADLRLTVDDGLTAALPGESTRYVVEVVNNGPSHVAVAHITAAPGGSSEDALSCRWTCVGSQGGQCTPGQVSGELNDTAQLPVNGRVTYSVDCAIDPAAQGFLHFVGEVTADGAVDPFPADNVADDQDTQLTPQVDLQLRLSDGVDSASPGDTLTYLLQVDNDGPSQATGALLTDTFPDAVASVTWQCVAVDGASCDDAGNAQSSGQGDIAQTVTLPPTGSLNITAVALLRSDAQGSVSNSAQISAAAGQLETHPEDNGAADTTSLNAAADLSVTLDDGLSAAVPGQAITYAMEVRNQGPADVLAARLLSDLGDALDDVQWTCTPTGGSDCPTAGLGELDVSVDLAAGGHLAFTLAAVINGAADGTLSPSVEVIPPASVEDDQPANNVATDADTVLRPSADLALEITNGVAAVVPGHTVSYAVQATNLGPSDAPGSRLEVLLPDSLNCTWACQGDTSADCPAELPGGSLQQILHLPAPSQLVFTAHCDVDVAATGDLAVIGLLATPESIDDPHEANHQATESDPLTPQADIVISKTDDQNIATPGDTLTYTLRARNLAGPSDAPGVTVMDTFPNSLDCLWSCQGQGGASCGQGQTAGHLLDIANLPVGSEAVYTAQCLIADDASGDIVNSATATPGLGLQDLNGSNNSALDTTQLRPLVDLAVQVDDGVETAVAGETLAYTVRVRHLSGPAVDDAVVRDAFPDDLSCLWTCRGLGGGICTSGQVQGDILDWVDLPPGGEVIYDAVCRIDPGASGTLANTATVEVPDSAHDPQPANNTGSDLDTQLITAADVSISVDDGLTSVAPGGQVTYAVAVTNGGPSSVVGLGVDVPFGEFLDCTWTCTTLEGGVCTAGPIAGDLLDDVELPADAGLLYEATCDVSAPAGSTLSLTGSLDLPLGVDDGNLFNNQSTDDDTRVELMTDVALHLDDGRNTAVPGTSTVYELVVQRAAESFRFEPAPVASGAGPDGGGQEVAGYRLSVVDTATGTYRLLGDLPGTSCGGLRRHGGDLGAWCHDPDGASETAAGAVWRRLRLANPDLEPWAEVADLGSPPASAADVNLTVQSTVPAALSCTWTCTATTGSACAPGPLQGSLQDTVTLAVGGRLTYQGACSIDPAATGTLPLAAQLVIPPGVVDPTPDDHQDLDANTLQPQADLRVSNSDGVTEAAPGGTLTYDIIVANDGPSDAPQVAVSDLFDSALSCLWSCQADDGNGCAAGQVAGDLLDTARLAAQSQVTYTAVCTIAADAAGTLSSTARADVQGGVQEIDPGNNSAADLDTQLVARGDLQLTLDDGVTLAIPGESVTYTLRVVNQGPSQLSGVRVENLFPEALQCQWSCLPDDGAGCAAGQNAGDLIDSVQLPPQVGVTYSATCLIDADARGTLTNQASVQVPDGATDPDGSNNVARDDDTTLQPVADLSISKTDGVEQVAPGDSLTYTLTVHNAGPSSASGTVQDIFAETLQCTWTCQPSAGAVCTRGPTVGDVIDPMELPAAATLVYTATCDLAADAAGTLLNNASVTVAADVDDPDLNNNSAADLDTVVPLADLVLSKTDGVDTAVPGESVIYTLVASNPVGPSPVSGAELRDDVSGVLNCDWTCSSTGAADCGSDTAPGSSLLAQLHLPVGGIVTWQGHCEIAPDATGTLTNTAVLTAPDGVLDLDPANNTASDTDTQLLPTADLTVSKDNGVTAVLAGDTVTYTMVARNLGPSDVLDATVHDPFPAELSCTWTCNAAPGTACGSAGAGGELLDIAHLPAAGHATYTATCSVSPSALGSISNTVSLSSENVADPDEANNTATDEDLLTDTADLALQVVDTPDPVAPGSPLLYALRVDNLGPAAAANLELTIHLPDLVELQSVVVGGPEVIFSDGFEGGNTDAWGTPGGISGACQQSADSLVCDLGTLVAAAHQEVTLLVQVDADADGTLVLTADIQGDGADPVSGNNFVAEVTTVN